VELKFEGDSVTLRLRRAEATRLGVALAAGYETISRAEYFIRTGLSEPGIRQIAQALASMTHEPPRVQSIPVEAGIEEIENPPRPRPPR
jgi:hypothetical protein